MVTKYNAEIFNARETTTPTAVAGSALIYSKSDGKLYYNSIGAGEVEIGGGGTPTAYVQTYADLASFPATGASNIVYIAFDTKKIYQWDGSSAYEELSEGTSTTLNVEFYAGEASLPATGTADVLYIAKEEASISIWDGISAYAQLNPTPTIPQEVQEYTDIMSFPATGVSETIYIDLSTKKLFRWNGTLYEELSSPESVMYVQGYPDLANFPPIGAESVIYIDISTNILYRWDGVSDYEELSPSTGGGSEPATIPWETDKDYTVGELIEYKGLLFKITSDHTSTTFDLSRVECLDPNASIITLGTFANLDVLYFDGSVWAKAIATDEATLSQPQKFVYFNDSTLALVCGQGIYEFTGHGLVPNQVNYLSDTTAGTVSIVEPLIYSNAIFKPLDANTIECLNWEAVKYENTGINLSDAPSDNKTYGRKNATWSEVETGIASVAWGDITGTIASQTDLTHNAVASIQGGTTNEYYHLTGAEHTNLTDGGDTVLHYHPSDRDRANHTGTQLSSTISDLSTTITATAHNSFASKQGGTTNEYYHMTEAQHAIATQAASATVAGYVTTGTQAFAGAKQFSIIQATDFWCHSLNTNFVNSLSPQGGRMLLCGGNSTSNGGFITVNGDAYGSSVSGWVVLQAGSASGARISLNGPVLSSSTYSLTTATASNVVVDSAGLLQRSTSAMKYKKDIIAIHDASIIYQIEPVTYGSKAEFDDQNARYIGIVADQVASLNDPLANLLVSYGAEKEDGSREVEGFQYERLTALLLKEIQSLNARLKVLEEALN